MQTKSQIARIASALAIAVILPLAILMTMVHGGKKPLAQPGVSTTAVAANVPSKVSPEEARKIAENYGRLPMSFEPNQGQTAPEVKFISRGPGYELFLTGQEAVIALRHVSAKRALSVQRLMTPSERSAARRAAKTSIVRMRLNGTDSDAQVSGLDPLPGKVNYFIGNDPKKWHTDIPTFASVKYSAVYPGIDLVYYGNQKELEYDFVVAPGADPKSIAFDVDGASAVHVDNKGELVLKTASGDVKFQKPFVYQENAGQRREIAASFVLSGKHEVRFALGTYDPSKELTIDPSVLIYSTYLGGSGINGDFAYGIALDGQGDAWVAGSTSSTDFPSSNGITPVPPELASGFSAAFVTEVNPSGTSFLYSTYLGGSGNANGGDYANGLAVDGNGNVYVTGVTESTDFPVSANAVLNSPPNAAVTGFGTGFVTALHPATVGNSQLVYSTYLGGNGVNGAADAGYAVATDGKGNAYVTGFTGSTDFPTVNTIVPTQSSPAGNAFVSEINTTATSGPASLIFSTLLGGSGAGNLEVPFGDIGQGITLDSAGHTYVAGATTSTDFAPTPAAGSTPCGDAGFATIFVVEIDTTVATPTPLFSYCYGGALGDSVGFGIAIAPDKTAVVTGPTFASDFKATNTIPIPAGVPNVNSSLPFVVKFNTTGSPTVAYATLFGGSSGDTAYGVATDSTGDIYVAGQTGSVDFPITQGALQVTYNNSAGTGFIAKLNPAGGGGTDLLYSSYFGGAGQSGGSTPDAANAIAVSSSNNAYIAGQATSANTGATPFPISAGAAQTTLGSAAGNAFVAELPLVPTVSVSPATLNFGSQPIGVATAPMYATVTNNTSSSVSLTIPPTFTGANAADFAYSATGTTPCGASLATGSACVIGVTFKPSVVGAESATLDLVDSDDTAAHPLVVALSGAGTSGGAVIGISPTSFNFGGELIGASSTAQPFTVSNTGTAALTITQIQSTSANFTETDNCTTAPVAPAGTCTINVTFAPPTGAAVGATSGNITITDNANGSPHSIAVSGTVWDFNLTVPATASVNKGSSAPFSVMINGLGGFAGTVSVACSSAASNIASCAVAPPSGAPGSSVMVTVTSTGMLAPIGSPTGTPPFAVRQLIFAAVAMMLLFLIPMTRRTRTRLGLAAAMLVFAVVAGCSGSAKTKTTTLTITGTSGTVSKTYTVNLTVTG